MRRGHFTTMNDIQPEHNLVAAIIRQAVEDMQDPRQRGKAGAFLASEWCEWLCGEIGVGVDAIREHIKNRQNRP